MKKVLIIVIALALIVWVISWFRVPGAVATSAAKPWPGGMGRLDAVPARFTAQKPNDASVKVASLANALPKNEAVDEFVWREISRGDLSIGQPPPLPDVSAIRELLLREPVIWERRPDEEIGDARTTALRATQITAARALVADALMKGRVNDPAAWDDLHAVWKLALSLDGHPQLMLQTASLSMARMITAVAWKMPLPAPAWLAELQKRDYVRPLLEAYQHQTASYWKDGASTFPTKWLADSVEHDRKIAEELSSLTQCDPNVRMNDLGVDLRTVWRRTFRYRAEREAMANALRVREGKPIEARSQCSDGGWTFDGTTVRFSREIPTTAPDRPMPLAIKVRS